jgi:hypothetical protein
MSALLDIVYRLHFESLILFVLDIVYQNKKQTSSGGFEPPTLRLTVARSNQLSYEDVSQMRFELMTCGFTVRRSTN